MIPIITYHALGNESSPVWTPLEVFDAHLAAFAHSGYRTVTLAELLACLHHRKPLPDNALVITFDDGYESVYREALPRLRSWGFTATIFLISDYCGGDNQWPGQPTSMPVASLLTWEQVATLADAGWELGAHTRSHSALPTLSPKAAANQILTSQQLIQQYTGQDVRVFAYPYGATNTVVTEIVQRHFDGAVGTKLGLVQSSSNPYLLTRIDTYYLKQNLIPQMRSSAFQYYLGLLQILRSVRRSLYPDWSIT